MDSHPEEMDSFTYSTASSTASSSAPHVHNINKHQLTPSAKENLPTAKRLQIKSVKPKEYLREALLANFEFDEEAEPILRTKIEEIITKWLLKVYSTIPFDENILHGHALGFAITRTYETKVHYSHGTIRNLRIKGQSSNILKIESSPSNTLINSAKIKIASTPQAIEKKPIKTFALSSPFPSTFKVPLPMTHFTTAKRADPPNFTTPIAKVSQLTPLTSPLARPLVNEESERSPKLARRTLHLQESLPGGVQSRLLLDMQHFHRLCEKKLSTSAVDYSNLDVVINENTFSDLVQKVVQECPVLADILKIFVSTADERKLKTASEKLLRAVHSQACLSKISNQKDSTFPLCFGILLVSFGCGEAVVDMLSKIGICSTWQTLMTFFDRRVQSFQDEVKKSLKDSSLYICMYDNWNRHFKTIHERLNKKRRSMWNFTVMSVQIIDINDFQDMKNIDYAMNPQKDITKISHEDIDIFGGKLQEHNSLWETAKASFLVKIINAAQNIPPDLEFTSQSDKNLEEKIKEFNPEEKLKLEDPLAMPVGKTKDVKIIHFPISTANCGTLDGNMKVLQQYSSILNIPMVMKENAMIFNSKEANFDLKESRERALFLERMKNVLDSELGTDEFELTSIDSRTIEHDTEIEPEGNADTFLNVYNEYKQMLFNTNNLVSLVEQLKSLESKKLDIKDEYGRCLLHYAVEINDVDMFNFLLNLGVNPNVIEKTGLTPLAIAVIKDNTDMIEKLLEIGADCKLSVPSALEVADDLGSNGIKNIFEQHIQENNQEMLNFLKKVGIPLKNEVPIDKTFDENLDGTNRKNLALIFGDNGVEKLVRAVKSRSGNFNNFLECPGDMHATGYAAECMAKTLGNSGMYHCLKALLKRRNDSTTFGNSKFQDGNHKSNKEACNDICMGYGLAVFKLFQDSISFPTNDELLLHGNNLLLKRFQLFIKELSFNENCNHYMQAITLFGPWLDLYKRSVSSNYGFGREVVWLVGILVYGPMQKKNYHTSAIVHSVNFLYHWPALIRTVVSNHFSISVKKKQGHNISCDEYVETYLVKPLKMYCSGRTSINMLKKLSVSSQIVQQIRDSYAQAFSFKKSHSHKIACSFTDQLKVSIFCIEQGFFDVQNDTVTIFENDGSKSQRKPSKNSLDVIKAGRDLLRSKFPSKMFSNFEEWRNKPN